MAVKGAKTIAEYAIKKWLLDQGFVMECFSLSINGNEAVLTYDSDTKSVQVKED